jgi:hypothetical protein
MGRLLLALLLVSAPAVWAQNIVSAQSGTVHYFEGAVLLDGKQIETEPGRFPQVKENSVLRTEAGRAEVLLTPGVFLRLGENTGLKMFSSKLSDTRLELLSGAAVLEVADMTAFDVPKTAPITVLIKNAAASIARKGLYRFDVDAGQIKVFDGQLEAASGDTTLQVKEGKLVALDGVLAVDKFNTKVGDPLLRWARRRAEYMSLASISAAKYASDWSSGWKRSSWLWNPYFGMFTFIPANGIYMSPFGYRFWSPGAVYRIYAPPPVYAGGSGAGWNANAGYNTMPRTYGGYSGVAASSAPSYSAPSTSAAGATSAPVSRGDAGGGGGRGGRSQ